MAIEEIEATPTLIDEADEEWLRESTSDLYDELESLNDTINETLDTIRTKGFHSRANSIHYLTLRAVQDLIQSAQDKINFIQ